MSEKALKLYQPVEDVERIAGSMVKSGYFQDTREMAQAVVKILAGQEMGFGPFASMTGVYIIQGRPSVSANLMAAAVKSSGRYNYRVIAMTDTVCELAFFEGGQEIGRSKFTAEDAKRAGTKNLDKFPRNMLFARAMSNGVRWFCPDVFSGAPTYTPEELGADVTESGDVIPGSFVEAPAAPAPAPAPKPEAPAAPDGDAALLAAMNEKDDDGNLYGSLPTEKLSHMFNSLVKTLKRDDLTDEERVEKNRKRVAAKLVMDSRQPK